MGNAIGELLVLIGTSFMKLRVGAKEGTVPARLPSNDHIPDPERDADP